MNLKSVEQIICHDTTIPATRPVTDNIFEFAEDYIYCMKIRSRGTWYDFERHIPKGYLTDKRTTPAIIWPIRPRDGLCEFATGGHDPDYETKGYRRLIHPELFILVNGVRSTMDKKAVDDMYHLSGDAVMGGTEPERDKVWLVMFGWIYWGKTKRAIKKLRKERSK